VRVTFSCAKAGILKRIIIKAIFLTNFVITFSVLIIDAKG
jgi:hypothetical protein